jgi:Uma2 family endonuclease
MMSLTEYRERDDRPMGDHFVHLDGTFDDYEHLLAMRGDRSAPRLAYLEGVIEIMSPSREHESIKSWIGRLVETWCLHVGLRFQTYGSWTLKERKEDRGVEPDGFWVFGVEKPDRPHLAIEVIWTAGGLDKLEIYRKLGVREVWVWRRGAIAVYALRGERYERLEASEVVPGIDLDQLASFLDRPTTYDAIIDYRAALAR